MPNASLRGTVNSLIRAEDFACKHVPAGITRGSSVSAVESLVTCRAAAHNRTLRFPSGRQVGNFNLINDRNTMETTTRETLHRPRPHPHQSVHTSFDPHVIFMYHIDSNFSYSGYYDHTYSTTSEFDVQKHARQPWIGIVRNHRRCLRRTLRKQIHWPTRIGGRINLER